MCGRYTLHTEREVLVRRFALDPDDLSDLEPHYNIAPSLPVLTVHQQGERLRASYMRWGLIPSWAKEGAELPSMINARVETADTRRAYRDSFRRQRCWVLASGFYEWQRPLGLSRRKTPHWIARHDGEPFAMAGLWAERRRAGTLLRSCTILTTAANELLRDIHERMPVILRPEHERAWLSPSSDDKVAELRQLLAPVSAADLFARPVSTAVNRVSNDGPQLIEPSDDPQLGFF